MFEFNERLYNTNRCIDCWFKGLLLIFYYVLLVWKNIVDKDLTMYSTSVC